MNLKGVYLALKDAIANSERRMKRINRLRQKYDDKVYIWLPV